MKYNCKSYIFKHITLMQYVFTLLLIVCVHSVYSQQNLTASQIIDTALQNNYAIKIAKIDTKKATANNSLIAAGALPTVYMSIGNTMGLSDTYQESPSGVVNSVSNNASNIFSGDLSANITLFNGCKIIASKQKLEYLQQQSELELAIAIQNTLSDCYTQYYEIIRQNWYLNILKKSYSVCKQKFDIIQNRYTFGLANKADLLQAKIDCNSIEQQIHNQELLITQSKLNLLKIIGSKSLYDFTLRDTISLTASIDKNEILQSIEKNPEYLYAYNQVLINEQTSKEIRSRFYPTVSLQTGYNFNDAYYDKGNYIVNKNSGAFVGANIRIPLYNGSSTHLQYTNSQLDIQKSELAKEELRLTLRYSVEKLYETYSTAIQQIEIQKNSYEDSKQLLYIVMERFSLNQATILEVKSAEASFEEAGYSLINLQFSAKIAEIQLQKLMFALK